MLHQQGGGDEFTSFMLAAVQHSESGWTQQPPAPPAGYVANLFDRYADDFSAHLSKLDYRAPEILVKAAMDCRSPAWPLVLDLGCGTDQLVLEDVTGTKKPNIDYLGTKLFRNLLAI